LEHLAELRATDNKLMGFPDKLRFIPSLSIIEVANNQIKDLKYL